MKFTLLGQIPAKKNTWRLNKWGKIYQSKKTELDELVGQLFYQSRNISGLPIKCNVAIILSLWQSNRLDLDNQITSICDILQASGIIENDRQVKHIEAKKFLDNKNPRVILEIKEI